MILPDTAIMGDNSASEDPEQNRPIRKHAGRIVRQNTATIDHPPLSYLKGLEGGGNVTDERQRSTSKWEGGNSPASRSFPIAPFRVVARYEGEVLSVTEESFTARVCTRSGPEIHLATVEFDLDEVNVYDRARIAPSAVFYWVIGYQTHRSRRKASFLTFAGYKKPHKEAIQFSAKQFGELLTED